jgi:hypothetical protein
VAEQVEQKRQNVSIRAFFTAAPRSRRNLCGAFVGKSANMVIPDRQIEAVVRGPIA